ncbi:MAG: DNA topoisomerase IV subunit A [Thermoproteota archaeon]
MKTVSKAKTSIVNLAFKILEQVSKKEPPSLEIPLRTVDNIIFDSKKGHYVLGPKKAIRTSRNVKHLKPLTQLIWAASLARNLVDDDKTSTLRDVFYMAEGVDLGFEDQNESDRIITELESIIGFPREDFHIYPEERSAIFADLTIEYTVKGYEGKRINLTSHPDGLMIGPALATAKFVKTQTNKVICIEKGAMFTRFIEEKAWKKYNAILIHTAGQAPRATRKLIRRLNIELDLPVYIFTDADPWGLHIAQVIISGSANAAHVPELATPRARWMGVYASDIEEYKLPSSRLLDIDIKRLNELKKDIRYQKDPWKREIEKFFQIKKKAEQEAFSKYGLSYMVDVYLKRRLA